MTQNTDSTDETPQLVPTTSWWEILAALIILAVYFPGKRMYDWIQRVWK